MKDKIRLTVASLGVLAVLFGLCYAAELDYYWWVLPTSLTSTISSLVFFWYSLEKTMRLW